MIKIPVDTHLAGRSFPKSLLSWVSLQMFSLHSYFPVKFGAALSSHITRSSAGGRYGSYLDAETPTEAPRCAIVWIKGCTVEFLVESSGFTWGSKMCFIYAQIIG